MSPVQTAAMVSTIANDGVWVAPRIVAATIEPRSTPQTIAFRPAQERRVVSTMTAAQMKKLLEGVVLFGTGRRALLEGYTAAGKTGTAQKVDPVTGTYSHTKYVATFAGFAPVNNPAVTVVVILDSAVGLHQGGQICAPVFQRITQQVLAYLNVPHDVDLPKERQLLLASRQVREQDLEEGSPDRVGSPLEMAVEPTPTRAVADVSGPSRTEPKPSAGVPVAEPVAMREQPIPVAAPGKSDSEARSILSALAAPESATMRVPARRPTSSVT